MKFKNLLLAAALVSFAAPAFATTYAVWPAATDGEVQIPNEFNHWWNFAADEVDGSMKCTAADNNSNRASSGWMTGAATGFDFAQLADKDLVFNAKVEGTGQWNVRLTAADGVESDVTLSVPADGQFHKVRINVAENYPAVAEKWKNGGANGKDVFTFSLSATNLSEGAALYFNSVRYVDAIATPKLTAEVADITTNSARISWTATFPEGYTNTKVTVNGAPAEGNELVLTDLAPKTAYTYTIVATGEFDGETFEASKVLEFTTPREAGDVPVWHGTTDKPGFTAEYSITYNPDGTLYVEALIETEKETVVADRNFHIYIGGDEWLKLKDDGTGLHSGTTTSTFTEGSKITWEWYMPYTGGVYQEANDYVVGSENEAPLAIKVKAAAQNVSFNGAEISYTVSAPEGAKYKVYYKVADGEAVATTANPIVLTGLAERTEYTYEVYAVLEAAEPLESRHATVTFKTTAENAVAYEYADLFAAEFKNALLPGEDETMRRSFFVTLPWGVVYEADGTAVYYVDLSAVENLVGLVPQIYWNGFQALTKNADSGLYEYHFGAQELEAGTAISHYFAYAGGVIDSRTPYTNWGMVKESPVLGEAASLALTASKKAAKVGEKVMLSAVAKDANGYYLSADGIELSATAGDVLEGSALTVKAPKGMHTVTATAGDLTATAEILVLASEESSNIIAGMTEAYTDEANIQGGELKNVTDADLNSQLEWRCSETEEHYLIYDLGADYYIEAVELLFEGAYATEFTVTLSSEAPAEVSPVATYAAGKNVVFKNEKNDIQHYFTQDPEETHRYVALRTTKALNTGWGIKVRDLKVHATEAKPSSTTTGVEQIAVDGSDAPVEFFDLRGVRVENPSAGLYIRRQGSHVSKVLVK